jgi:hypothetical protein
MQPPPLKLMTAGVCCTRSNAILYNRLIELQGFTHQPLHAQASIPCSIHTKAGKGLAIRPHSTAAAVSLPVLQTAAGKVATAAAAAAVAFAAAE